MSTSEITSDISERDHDNSKLRDISCHFRHLSVSDAKMADELVHYLAVVEMIENQAEVNRRNVVRAMRLHRRNLRDHSDPFSISENLFVAIYRLSKEAAMMLVESLTPHLRPVRRSTCIPPWMRVLCTLNFLASGSYQRRVGQDFLQATSQSSTSMIIREVTRATNHHLLNTWIRFPFTQEARQANKEEFMRTRQFPGVIGCVDGTHIAIFPPTRNREYLFLNRKGYTSKNVQIVCDHDLRIIAINARHGGRSHDSHIWRLSAVREEMAALYEAGERGTWLLGDSGYPSEPWLLRPFANHPDVETPEGRYNARLCSCRSTVERCIGVLKARFRCCRKERGLHYSPEVAGLIINTCAVVHNIAIHYRVANPPPIFDVIDLPQNQVAAVDANGGNGVHAAGQAARARIVRDHFTH